jgi:predicted nucleic acid-binding protein
VLRHVYHINEKRLAVGLTQLLGLPNATVESASQVAEALKDFSNGMDFADALHLASTHSGIVTYTFDKKFAKLATADRVVLATRKSSKPSQST